MQLQSAGSCFPSSAAPACGGRRACGIDGSMLHKICRKQSLVAPGQSPGESGGLTLASRSPHLGLIFPYQEGPNRHKITQSRPKAAKDSRKAAKDDPGVAKDAPNVTNKPPKTSQRSPETRSCSHSDLLLPTQTHEISGFTEENAGLE